MGLNLVVAEKARLPPLNLVRIPEGLLMQLYAINYSTNLIWKLAPDWVTGRVRPGELA